MTTQLKTRRRSRRKNKRAWIFIILLLSMFAATAIWYVYFREAATVTEEDLGPETVAVSPQLYRETVAGTGTLEPIRTLDLGFDVSGSVLELAHVGQRVNAGDVIARLNTNTFERSLRDAEFALEQAQTRLQSTASSQSDSQVNLQESITTARLSVQDAERELTRTEADYKLKQALQTAGSESAENVQAAQDALIRAQDTVVKAELNLRTLEESQSLRTNANEQDLRNSELSVQAAQLGLERAQEDLLATTLLAPFSGVIASLAVSEGNTVNANAAVLSIIDDSSVKLEAQVDETEIALVSLGLSAEVELDAVSDKTFVGEVITISPAARLVSNIPIFDVTIKLDNTESLMRSGMTAEAEILIREVADTVSVPSRSLQTVRNRSYVSVLAEDGAFALQPVKLVSTSGLNTIVQASLPPGSEVLIPASEIQATPETEPSGSSGFRLPFIGGRRN